MENALITNLLSTITWGNNGFRVRVSEGEPLTNLPWALPDTVFLGSFVNYVNVENYCLHNGDYAHLLSSAPAATWHFSVIASEDAFLA